MPVAFGVDAATLGLLNAATRTVAGIAGLELAQVPDLDAVIPDLAHLLTRLEAEGAQSSRSFRFDRAGAIRACFSFLRMAGPLAEMPTDALAMAEALAMLAAWSRPLPLVRDRAGQIGPAPRIARLIAAAYDPALPAVPADRAHAMRLWARAEGVAGRGG